MGPGRGSNGPRNQDFLPLDPSKDVCFRYENAAARRAVGLIVHKMPRCHATSPVPLRLFTPAAKRDDYMNDAQNMERQILTQMKEGLLGNNKPETYIN